MPYIVTTKTVRCAVATLDEVRQFAQEDAIDVEPKNARFFLDLLTGEDVNTVAAGIAAYNAAQEKVTT